jgi:hypothetical protein
VNGCLFFDEENSEYDYCRTCHAKRYKQDMLNHRAEDVTLKVLVPLTDKHEEEDDNQVVDVSMTMKKEKFTARYQLLYCPLLPRLRYLLAHPVFSHLFEYGEKHRGRSEDGNRIDDIHQAEIWELFERCFPLVASQLNQDNKACDVRVAFGLSADRASLSKQKQSTNFACLPLLLSIINWPIWIRNKEMFLLLIALPPMDEKDPSLAIRKNKKNPARPTRPPPPSHLSLILFFNLCFFLPLFLSFSSGMLMKEILVLTYRGIDAMDGRGLLYGQPLRPIRVRGCILFTTSDIPATTPFTGCSLRGYMHACKNCHVQGKMMIINQQDYKQAQQQEKQKKQQMKKTKHKKRRRKENNGEEEIEEEEDEESEIEEEGENEEEEPEEEEKEERTKKVDTIFFPGHIRYLPSDNKSRELQKIARTCMGDAFNRYVGDGESTRVPLAPESKSAGELLELGEQFALCVDEDDRKRLSDQTGCRGRPALHEVSEVFNVVNNTIHDFMHLFYNVILLVFSYMIRDHFKDVRKLNFFRENRKIEINGVFTANDRELKNQFSKQMKRSTTYMLWQASNKRLRALIRASRLRRVPIGDDPSNLDCPFAFDKSGSPSLAIDNSAAWVHMIGPIGVYYIHALDIHIEYKRAFCSLLWELYYMRRRFVLLDQLSKSSDEANVTSATMLLRVLSKLEYLMPIHFNTIVIHLLQHAHETLRFTGPPHATWMFVFERWVQIAKKSINSANSAMITLFNAITEREWCTFGRYQTINDLNDLISPPPSHSEKTQVKMVGAGKRIKLDERQWRCVYNFLLDEDPLYSIISDEYKARNPTWERKGRKVEEWVKTVPETSKVAMREKIEEMLNVSISEEQLVELMRGPSQEVIRYSRFESNGTTFVTEGWEKEKGRLARKHCFYLNQKQIDDMKEGKRPHIPIARLHHIYQISIANNINMPSLRRTYHLLAINNFQYLADHPTQLPHVTPLSRSATERTQPIIQCEAVRPYNIALWPANYVKDNKHYVAVWIDAHHYQRIL